MRKLLIPSFVLMLLTCPVWVNGQGYTINMTSGTLHIHEVREVTLIGTNENKVTIEIEGDEDPLPEKAKGLKLISPSGKIDNTGLGLEVKQEGDVYKVQAVSNRAEHRYIFKVPKGILVRYEATSNFAEDLIVENVQAELDISVSFNSVHLSGVTGPLAVHSVHGDIEANFASVSQNGPISLYSAYSDVDVTIPASSKATFKIRVDFGDVYSDLDLKYESGKEGLKNLSGGKFTALLNGGGIEFTLKSGHSNIYLRSK